MKDYLSKSLNWAGRQQRRSYAAILPLVFVALYGSAFVVLKPGLTHCPPLTFLTVRFAIAALVAALIALAIRAPWPEWRQVIHIAVAGLLTIATFSAGVFVSIDLGISPALSALIISLQPLLVGVLARHLVREHVSRLNGFGLGLGFIGVALVVGHKLRVDGDAAIGVACSVVGLLGLTAGNLYQKRFCDRMNVFTGGAIQAGVSALITAAGVIVWETPTIEWTPVFIASLLYMSIAVSVGALTLLFMMIRRNDVSRVASVFYLVPLPAAVVSPFMFGDRFDTLVLVGIAVIFIGVLLVNWKSKPTSRSRDAARKYPIPSELKPVKFALLAEESIAAIPWTCFTSQGRKKVAIHTLYECGSPRRRLALMRLEPQDS